MKKVAPGAVQGDVGEADTRHIGGGEGRVTLWDGREKAWLCLYIEKVPWKERLHKQEPEVMAGAS